MNKPKNRKLLWFILKLLLAIAAWTFVIHKIYNTKEIIESLSILKNLENEKIKYLVLLIVLMPVNWLLEAIKWQKLINQIEKVSILKSYKAVWIGVAVGSLTPNRIGEFGGRISVLQKTNRISATAYTLYGDLAQFIITFIIGLFSFVIIINTQVLSLDVVNYQTLIIIIGLISLIITSFIYLKINTIITFFHRKRVFSKLTNKLFKLKSIPSKLKTETLLLSFIRYLVFTLQFYLALRFFGIEISFINAVLAISSIYLAQTIIPNIPFVEIGIRLSFSIVFLGLFSNQTALILLSSTSLYLINVLIPVLFGAILMLFNDKNHYS